jgi:hypothetical protein
MPGSGIEVESRARRGRMQRVGGIDDFETKVAAMEGLLSRDKKLNEADVGLFYAAAVNGGMIAFLEGFANCLVDLSRILDAAIFLKGDY